MEKLNKIRNEKLEVRRYSEALKFEVVKSLDSGSLTVSDAMEFYDIPWRRTINRWRQKYGKNSRETRIVRVMMKSEQERIRELEKALADKELELLRMKTFLLTWEEDYGEDLKKKVSPERLETYEKLRKSVEPLLQGSAKRSG